LGIAGGAPAPGGIESQGTDEGKWRGRRRPAPWPPPSRPAL